jgi:hypothetical protein
MTKTTRRRRINEMATEAPIATQRELSASHAQSAGRSQHLRTQAQEKAPSTTGSS